MRRKVKEEKIETGRKTVKEDGKNVERKHCLNSKETVLWVSHPEDGRSVELPKKRRKKKCFRSCILQLIEWLCNSPVREWRLHQQINMGPLARQFFKRNVGDNPHCKSSDIAEQVYVSLRAAATSLHKLAHYGRIVSRKHQSDWANEMVKRLLEFWDSVILSDESRFAVFTYSDRVGIWRLCNQGFDVNRLQPKM